MRVVDLICRKRDGGVLTRGEIEFLIAGVTDGSIPEYQVSAWLMAVLFRGMTDEETYWLTDAMLRSGGRADWSDVAGAKVDKHSTGGVGDKTSLVIAPLAAACGVVVPMMSGRALGHTGGTLDKLESIPGFRTNLSLREMREALVTAHCALIGQTSEIAPADRRLYGLRDVTGTVESIPLIAASIMSKKLAEGIDGLVLDVKCGSGAFMKTEEAARRLAAAMTRIGRSAGVRTEALVTAMDAPLGCLVGNALEVVESIETLKGRGPADLTDLSVRLAARMLLLGGAAGSEEEADQRIRAALASGAGVEKFRQVIAIQGGDSRVVDDYDRLPAAPGRHVVAAPRSGYLTRMEAGRIGLATMVLGAGRRRLEDAVDHGVGARLLARRGDRVSQGDGVLELHYRDDRQLAAALALATEAIEVGDAPPAAAPLVLGLVA
jgi:pyrimidine-nucleoside phosphorylase